MREEDLVPHNGEFMTTQFLVSEYFGQIHGAEGKPKEWKFNRNRELVLGQIRTRSTRRKGVS
jgi:hypothetical protein